MWDERITPLCTERKRRSTCVLTDSNARLERRHSVLNRQAGFCLVERRLLIFGSPIGVVLEGTQRTVDMGLESRKVSIVDRVLEALKAWFTVFIPFKMDMNRRNQYHWYINQQYSPCRPICPVHPFHADKSSASRIQWQIKTKFFNLSLLRRSLLSPQATVVQVEYNGKKNSFFLSLLRPQP